MAANAKRGTGRRSRRRPGNWPVRWRLAAASAGLTLAILLLFGGVIGNLAAQRVRGDFNRELKDAITTLASEEQVIETDRGPLVTGVFLDEFVLPNGASVRVLSPTGQVVARSHGAGDLGPAIPGIHDVGSLRVATDRIFSRASGQLAGYVQVKNASLENGLLHVDLVREIPEAKKPRQIPIGNGNAKAQVIETKAAA